jgi:hypothetical protein
LLALLGGCQPVRKTPVDTASSNLLLQPAYLCCNLRFNQDNDATDANYEIPAGGRMLPAGTRVRVSQIGSTFVRFRTSEDSNPYYLELRFGRNRLSPRQYFDWIFVAEDPTTKLSGWPDGVQQAVRDGKVVEGMTREQVLMARGYPPLHRTVALESALWTFYETRVTVSLVLFEGDRVVAINTSSAP